VKGRNDKNGHHKGKLTGLKAEERALGALLAGLGFKMEQPPELRGRIWHKWIAMSLFTPVYAALAYRHCQSLGSNFEETVFLQDVIHWRKDSAPFCPTTVVFDLTNHTIGETCPSWDLWIIQKWEQSIRDQRFPLTLRAKYHQARQIM
jgi:hypothetical protein